MKSRSHSPCFSLLCLRMLAHACQSALRWWHAYSRSSCIWHDTAARPTAERIFSQASCAFEYSVRCCLHAIQGGAHARRDVTVCILDRPRHADLIKQCREAGARIRLLSDGDVAGACLLRTPSPHLLPCFGNSWEEPVFVRCSTACAALLWLRRWHGRERLSCAKSGLR